jgi:hypothetical protein
LAAFFALASLAGAAPIATYPSGNLTPAAFGKACLDGKGILTEYKQGGVTITKSTCYHDKKKSSECDWIKKTCSDYFVPAPTTGVQGFPSGGGLSGGSPGATRGGVADVAPTGGGVATSDEEP